MAQPDVMQPVVSSNVNEIGYDEASEELWVRFRGDSLYMYSGVPKAIYEALLGADSVGGALNQMIKGVYSYRKVS